MENWIKNFRENIEKVLKGKVEYFYDLKMYNSMRLSCIADVFVEVEGMEDISIVAKFLNKKRLNYLFLGAGTNVILPPRFNGIVIKPGKNFSYVKFYKEEFEAGAGTLISEMLGMLLRKRVRGFEFLAGIPGTVGGAVKGNAGAFRKSIGEVVKKVEVFDFERLKINILSNDDLRFEYRRSDIKSTDFITRVYFNFEKTNWVDIVTSYLMMKRIILKRKFKHPTEPSCGSIFKNPTSISAGRLIEEAGLKKERIGGAMVSSKHANFIINTGNATYDDIVKLIEFVKKRVFEKFKIKLVEEVIIVKNPGGRNAKR